MGNCCSDSNETITEKHKTVSLKNPQLTPSSNYNNIPLNQILTLIIKKHNSNPLLTLKKFSLEQIWNILKTHKENASFPIKDYILFDLRPTIDQKELFLKAFVQLPFSENDLEIITGTHVQALKKYLENKTLILLIPDNKKNEIENIIQRMINRHIAMKLCLINNSMDVLSFNSSLKELYILFDKKFFQELPYILFSLKHLSYLSNEGMIFYKAVDYSNAQSPSAFKYCNEFVSNSSFWKKADNTIHPVKSFFDSFAIGTILLISKEANYNDNNIDERHVSYSNNEHIKSLFTIKLSLLDFIDGSKFLNEHLNTIKGKLKNQKHSLFLQIDNKMTQKEIITIFLIVLWKLTEMPPFKLLLYAEDNFIFIDKAKGILHQENKSFNGLFTQYGYQSEKAKIQKEVRYEELTLLEDKVSIS